MASRRKMRKQHIDVDPLGGFSLDDLMGLELLSDAPGPSKGATIAAAPFRLSVALLKLPFKLVGGIIRAPFKMLRAILPGGRKKR